MERITENSIGLDGQVFAERRGQVRHRVLKGATLNFNRGYGALEAIVRNLSDGGARLDMGETGAVPSAFQIRISGEEGVRRGEVRWRTFHSVGIAFVAN